MRTWLRQSAKARAAMGLLALLCLTGRASAQSICAAAKIELGQEAALEREGFAATLSMTNNLADQALTGLRIELIIKDAAGRPAESLFFANVTSLEGASAIDGTGSIQPSGSAKTRWLIIPSPGAGGTGAAGVRYTVQARMSMLTGGVPRVVTTFPVAITVKPQPLLTLEYVLPFEVFGDEPMTTVHESTVPFPLGLRVSNVGAGAARNFRVQSNQPLITDNAQGLAVDFSLLGTWLGPNALPENTLLIPFGDIPAGGAKQAAWSMVSTLSGRFVNFTSTFTHAAELGGALTSLIQSVTTYTLVKDVIVDLPGRDAQFDFLVNVTTPRSQMEADFRLGREPKPEFLMESDRPGLVPVVDVPAKLTGSLSGAGSVLHLNYLAPVSSNTWVHAAVPAPNAGAAPLVSVTRADGKVVSPRNAWISKHFDKDSRSYSYFLHVLDYSGETAQDFAMAFNAASLDTPPNAIADLTATPYAAGALDLRWTATGEDGSAGAIFGGRYAIFATTDSTVAPSPQAALVSFATSTNAGAAQSFRLGGLAGNATYFVYVYLADASGRYSAASSNRAAARTLANPPRDVRVLELGAASFGLAWDTSHNAAGTLYQLRLSSGPGVVPAETPFTADLSSIAFAGLDANRTYFVAALERNGSSALTPAVTIATVTTSALPPGATSPAFVAVTTDSVTARWTTDGNPPDTEFYSELSTSASRAPVFAASGWVRASGFTFSGLPPGTEFFGRVKARNRVLVETAYADLGAVRTAPVDNLPPRTAFAPGLPRHGDSPVYVATATPLGFAAFDDKAVEGDGAGLGVAQTFFAIDSSSFSAYTGTFTLVALGTHTIRFYSVDVLGNVEVERSAQVAVDGRPARTAVAFGEPKFAGATLYLSSTTEVRFSAADDLAAEGDGRGVGTARTLLSLDSAAFAPVVSTMSIPTEGAHGLAWFSLDLVDNAELVASTSVAVDLTPPVTVLSISTPSATRSSGTVVGPATVLSLAARDPVSSGTASGLKDTFLAVSTSVFALAPSTFTLGGEDGARVVSFYSRDNVLNAGQVVSATVLLDATPPVSTATIGAPLHVAADGTRYVTPATPVVFSAQDPAVNGVAAGLDRVEVSVDGAAFAAYVSTLTFAEGPHTILFRGVDLAGNVEEARTLRLQSDATPPVTALEPSGAYFAADGRDFAPPSFTYALRALDPVAGGVASGLSATLFRVDGSAFARYVSTFSLAEGPRRVDFESEDNVGNRELLKSATVFVDATPPVTDLSIGAPRYVAPEGTLFVGSAAAFALASQDPPVQDAASGVRAVSARVDAAAFALYGATFTLSPGDGLRTVSWFAADNVGNAETPKVSTVALDGTAPRTSLLIVGGRQLAGPDAETFYASSDTRLVLVSIDPAVNGSASGVAFTRWQDGAGAFETYLSGLALAEGAHALAYRSSDNVENLEVPRSTNVWIDAAPPVSSFAFGAPYHAAPDGTHYVAPATPVTFSANDPALPTGQPGSGLSRVEVAVDGGPFAAYTSSLTFAEGRHTVLYRSIDGVGNVEATRALDVRSDATAPLTALALSGGHQFQGPDASSFFASADTLYSLPAADPVVKDVASGVAFTRRRDNGGPFQLFAAPFALAEGVHRLDYQSSDRVSNLEIVRSTTALVDATAPLTALQVLGGRQFPGPDAATFYASSDTRLALPAADPAAAEVASGLAFTRYQDGDGSFQAFVSTFGLPEGAHRLGYQSQDNVHNLEVLRSTNVWIDAAPPASSFAFGTPFYQAPDGTRYVTPATPVMLSAVDPALTTGQPGSGVGRIEVAIDGGPFTVYSAALTLAEGRHTILFRAIDNVANAETARTLQVRSDATPPVSSLVVGQPQFQLPEALLVSTRTPFSVAAIDPIVNDAASGVKDAFYRVSDLAASSSAFTTFAAPFSLGGPDVTKFIEFYSRDNVLNTEVTRSSTVLLDSTGPELALRSPGTCDSGICRVLNGRFPVLGTARDAHFQSYALESASGKDAAAGFVLVSSGTVAVSSATLGVWDAAGLSGWQTLRLTGTDQVQNAAVVAINVFVGDPATLLVLGGHETFNMPEGVAVGTDGNIYVADRNNDRVAVFSSTGAALAAFGGRQPGEDDDHPRSSTSTLRLKQPSAVAVDGAGILYVADTGHHRVLKLSAAGEVLLDIGRRKTLREEGEKGKVELEAEFKAGRAPGEFKKPAGIAVDAAGRIYVSDTDNHRVQVFSSTGAFALAFSMPPLPPSPEDDETEPKDDDDESPELGKPAGIALDSAGNIYVADPKGRRALAFDAAGRLLMTVPVSGRKPGQGARPVGIAVSPSGECLLVSDQKGGRILKYDFQGNLNLAFGGKGSEGNEDGERRAASSIKLRKPSGLAMDAAGALYVVDRNNERVKKFSLPDGSATVVMPPQGADEDHNVAREVIDREDGGRVERKDRAAVSIPADALPEDLKISVTTPTAAVAAESRRGADDKNMKVASPPVEYQPHGTEFEKPVTLTIPYNPELLAAQKADDADLKVHYWNDGKKAWEELESTVDKPNRVVRAKTTHFSLYQVFTGTSAPAAISPLAADASFGLKAAYAFPNPARGVGSVTIRIQPGLADSVQVNVYDVSGRKVHSSSDFRSLGAFDDGNGLGAQFTYDHVWDISGVGSGVYAYVITARKSGERDIHRSGKIGVVK